MLSFFIYFIGYVLAYYALRHRLKYKLKWDWDWDNIFITALASIGSYFTLICVGMINLTESDKQPPKWL